MTPISPKCPVCDIYLRLSELRADDLDDDGESKNLLEGRRVLSDYVASRLGWTLGEVIVENDLTNEGKPKPASAYRRKRVKLPDGTTRLQVLRPGFRLLLHRLSSGQSQAFATIDLDRAMRDPRDLEDLIDVVEATRANVRSLTGSLQFTDGGTDAEITLARVLVAMANKSSRDTARRVAAARLRQARAGERNFSGNRAFGWEADGVTVVPAERDVVRQACDAVLAGLSLRSIAFDLRRRAIPTVTGAAWSTQGNLRDLLLRPRNAGLAVNRKAELTGVTSKWEPLIDVETYRAVAAILTNPDRDMTKGGRAPRWLGSGIYRCVCGSYMGGLGPNTRKGTAALYKCRTPELEPGPHVRRDAVQLDAYVSKAAVKRLNMPDAASLLRKRSPVEKIDVAALRRKAGRIRARMVQDANDEADDKITREQLHSRTRRFRQKLEAIEKQLTTATQVSPLQGLIGITLEQWNELPLGTRRAAISEMMEVKVLPTRRGRLGFNGDAVQITFKD